MIPFIPGCASIFARVDDSYKSTSLGPYPAVRGDVETLGSLVRKDYDPLLTGAEPLVFTLSLLDIPLATALDTVFLPFDLLSYHGYLQKVRSLASKHFPEYKISKNPGIETNKKAAFYLISPSGAEVNLLNNRKLDGDEIVYPELNIILQKQNLRVLNDIDAREITELIDLLMFGRVLSGKWKYVVRKEEGLWIVRITDKKTNSAQLGLISLLKVDNNHYLLEIRGRGHETK